MTEIIVLALMLLIWWLCWSVILGRKIVGWECEHCNNFPQIRCEHEKERETRLGNQIIGGLHA